MPVEDLILSPRLSPGEVLQHLQPYGFEDPGEADRRLQRLAELVGDRQGLARLLPSLLEEIRSSADPDQALLQLERFWEAVPHPLNLLRYLSEHPLALAILLRILGNSPFLGQLLIRTPHHLYWLLEGERLREHADLEYFRRQVRQAMAPFPRREEAWDALRRWRRREILRIAAQDLLGWAGLVEVTAQLSDLAQAVVEAVLEGLLPTSRRFAVLALGKLGGRELNYSSDIDLLYMFEGEAGPFLRVARELTRVLSEYTPEGHLYRVDLRLRPMGRGGEIAYSLDAYAHYYETWADTLDRLALLKCRFLAGDRELGERFGHLAHTFVYKTYWDTAALEEIRWLKKRIDTEVASRGGEREDVKLGQGGIREVEFFVQAFQLLHGGRQPELRTPHTLSALDRLVDGGYISTREYATLREAYLFFRRLEHRLQLVHDRQTHSLPRDTSGRRALARALGAPSGEEGLLRELRLHSRGVQRIFSRLFEDRPKTSGLEELVLEGVEREEALRRLRKFGFQREDEVWEGIQLLLEAPAFPHSPRRLRNLLGNLLPRFLPAANQAEHPRRLFARLDRFCQSLGARASLFSALVEDPQLSRRLLTLLALSESLAETLIRNPELLDSLTSPRVALEEAPRPDPQQPEERFIPALRRFQQLEAFKVALLDLFEGPRPEHRLLLSSLAEICLELAWRHLLWAEPQLAGLRFQVLALGKLGGRELTHHSDLDLILVYDERGKGASPQRLRNVVLSLQRLLQDYTFGAPAYRLDFRLRPEGRHGPLATPLSVLERYWRERAEVWEALAFVKLRPVLSWGEPFPLPPLWRKDPFRPGERDLLRRIRGRQEKELAREGSEYDFKIGRGGLTDLHFLIQYLQIQHQFPQVQSLLALEGLRKEGVLGEETAAALEEGLGFLYRLESLQRLLQGRPSTRISRSPRENQALARQLGYSSGRQLLAEYRRITAQNRRLFRQVFSAGSSPQRKGA